MNHEPPPRHLRTFAIRAEVVMEAGGRFLLWLGPAVALIAVAMWLAGRESGAILANDAVLALLFWAVILVGWHMVLAFVRWWIWWHDEA